MSFKFSCKKQVTKATVYIHVFLIYVLFFPNAKLF